jgi:hypothetical protein
MFGVGKLKTNTVGSPNNSHVPSIMHGVVAQKARVEIFTKL